MSSKFTSEQLPLMLNIEPGFPKQVGQQMAGVRYSPRRRCPAPPLHDPPTEEGLLRSLAKDHRGGEFRFLPTH